MCSTGEVEPHVVSRGCVLRIPSDMFYAIVFATTNSGTAARSVVAAESRIKKVGDFRVLSGFDSLNANFHSNWPFGPSYSVLYDYGRG